jgi:plasmid stabilization system protein ParE
MKYSLTIRKEAELDINSAFEYYEIQRLGLGHDFLLCVEEALSKIERNPTHYKITYKELRRIAVRRFPYRVFYLIQNQQVIVTAVFHARKDPQLWDSRS